MNSCVLMAKIISNPQLRYTQDGQKPFTEMLVEFAALRPEEPPATLKVVGWGNLATEMVENYIEGNWVIIEGRISINRFERREGFKETKAEFIVSHIYRVEGQVIPSASVTSSGAASSSTATAASRRDNVVPMNSFKSKQPEVEMADEDFEPVSPPPQKEQPSRQPVTSAASSSDDQDLDDIPFVRPVSLRTCDHLQDSWELLANRPGNWLHGVSDLWR
ncbi:single-stranded DNA-binding protein [Gloeothece verrucosa]|uniref:Single-strand binding protein/Primosomal replication protein n n=1 Tax=Gloeothece verrucosa (strain PCC 7822) TaxID=497965 RepID=E0U6F1_GLOV7|nr:single-stranded DNA-binding protein [Gloeothece verrucosa]ADN13594.1 single-strand binding protein/Primosomal replication protein n [Gloeothece verrucosa PCC 7822]